LHQRIRAVQNDIKLLECDLLDHSRIPLAGLHGFDEA